MGPEGGQGGGVARRPDGRRGNPRREGRRERGGGGEARLGGGGAGGEARGAARFPSPSPGPGLPLTQPHGVGRLGPDSQCARLLRRRRRGGGQAAGALRLRLRLRPAAPGRRVLAEAAAVSGSTHRDCGGREHCAGAMRPPLSVRAGRGQGTRRLQGNWAAREGQPQPPPCLSDGGGGRRGATRQSLYIAIATRRRNRLINLWWYRGNALTLSPWQLGTAPSFFLSNRVTIPPPCLTNHRRNNHLHLIP